MLKNIFFIIFIVTLTGCKREIPQSETDESHRFYKSLLNDSIYYDDQNPFSSDLSLPDTDFDTFLVLKGSTYALDKNNVYYRTSKIKGADPKSFKTLSKSSYLYASDSIGFYYKERLIHTEPSDSFKIFNIPEEYFYSDGSYIKIGDTLYVDGEPRSKDVNEETFQLLNFNYQRDDSSIYFRGKKLDFYDVETFEILNVTYTKDKNGYYYNDKKIKDLDYDSVSFKFGEIIDKDFIYFRGIKESTSHSKSLKKMGEYIYDKNNVYFNNKILKKDYNTLEIGYIEKNEKKCSFLNINNDLYIKSKKYDSFDLNNYEFIGLQNNNNYFIFSNDYIYKLGELYNYEKNIKPCYLKKLFKVGKKKLNTIKILDHSSIYIYDSFLYNETGERIMGVDDPNSLKHIYSGFYLSDFALHYLDERSSNSKNYTFQKDEKIESFNFLKNQNRIVCSKFAVINKKLYYINENKIIEIENSFKDISHSDFIVKSCRNRIISYKKRYLPFVNYIYDNRNNKLKKKFLL